MIKTNREKIMDYFIKNPKKWFRQSELRKILKLNESGMSKHLKNLLIEEKVELKILQNNKNYYKLKKVTEGVVTKNEKAMH